MVLAVLAGALLGAAGCAGPADPEPAATPDATPAATPETTPAATPEARLEPAATLEPEEPVLASDGRPVRAALSIPRLGITDLAVLPYRGVTDDAPGSRIQDGGVAASPHGPGGGVGPGGVGSFQVTGHRLSAGGVFRELPSLVRGDRVHVEALGTRYVYEITGTRTTSFRSARSLREQRAAVPGRPGVEPTQAMIVLSTCRTLEDHAEGNYWSDRFGNPEHRIDKIGVLRRIVPAGG